MRSFAQENYTLHLTQVPEWNKNITKLVCWEMIQELAAIGFMFLVIHKHVCCSKFLLLKFPIHGEYFMLQAALGGTYHPV